MNIEESERRAAELIERREFHEAERLLSALSDRGSVYAPMALAWMYENGRLGEKDRKAARRFHELAIARGSIEATLHLGLLLLEEGHPEQARTVFEKGAEREHAGCIGELGWMLVKGIGGDVRAAEGRKMLEDASSRGHLLARRRIISLELSASPPLTRRIALIWRLLALAPKVFSEAYRNRNSNKIW